MDALKLFCFPVSELCCTPQTIPSPRSKIPFGLVVRFKSKVFSGNVLLVLQGDKPLMVAFVPV